jgi:purine nucleoside phosphorylase
MVALLEFVASAGVDELVVTAAVGSLQRNLKPGEFVLVDRILDFQNRRPLRVAQSTHIPRPVTRALALDSTMNRRLERSSLSCGVPLVRGTLASCSGPTYETHAEADALRRAEASVASMSVAPEVATAAALGIRVACLALVTNWVTGITRVPLDHEDVLEAGRSAAGTLRRLLAQFVSTA